MAIKEKLPSPSEVAKSIEENNQDTPQTSGQDTPNSEVKFTSEEIEKIQKLQSDSNSIMFQFGQLKVNQIKLEQQEKFLQEQLAQLEQQEKTIAKELTDKYGKGSLDIETGNFSPIE
tara:strand:+ start:275 stop:625 length:351 start_codon:yes stop_codon:yes gene_type:complete